DDRQPEPDAPKCSRLPDLGDEVEVGRATAQRDVVAVVGRRARIALALGQGLNCATERRSRFGELHVVALARELERGRKAGEPATDDRDPHSATTARIFSTVDRWGGSMKTSYPRARIWSSRPR